MFEYVYVFDGVANHITPPVAPIWVKIIAAETFCMVQTELFDCNDKGIKDFTAWKKLLLEKGVSYDKHLTTVHVEDWTWSPVPSYITLVSLIFYET